MYRTKQLAGWALGIALLAALALAFSANPGAQEGQGQEVQLTQSRNSGVSGTATLKSVQGGVEVTLEMQNLPQPGVKHINHIHAGGTCADDRAGRTAPVTIPLKTIVAKADGSGSATTTIEDVTVSELFGEDKERFILLHAKTEKGEGVPPGIACADLVRTASNGASPGDETTVMGETTMLGGDLPGSGGSPILLPAAALIFGVGVLSYAVLRRRM